MPCGYVDRVAQPFRDVGLSIVVLAPGDDGAVRSQTEAVPGHTGCGDRNNIVQAAWDYGVTIGLISPCEQCSLGCQREVVNVPSHDPHRIVQTRWYIQFSHQIV